MSTYLHFLLIVCPFCFTLNSTFCSWWPLEGFGNVGDVMFCFDSLVRSFFLASIRGRVELRKKLKCKSFKWYLDNVYPELRWGLVLGGKVCAEHADWKELFFFLCYHLGLCQAKIIFFMICIFRVLLSTVCSTFCWLICVDTNSLHEKTQACRL